MPYHIRFSQHETRPQTGVPTVTIGDSGTRGGATNVVAAPRGPPWLLEQPATLDEAASAINSLSLASPRLRPDFRPCWPAWLLDHGCIVHKLAQNCSLGKNHASIQRHAPWRLHWGIQLLMEKEACKVNCRVLRLHLRFLQIRAKSSLEVFSSLKFSLSFKFFSIRSSGGSDFCAYASTPTAGPVQIFYSKWSTTRLQNLSPLSSYC